MSSIVNIEEMMNKQLSNKNWLDSRHIVAGSMFRKSRLGSDGTLGSELEYWNGQKRQLCQQSSCDDQPHHKYAFGLNLTFTDYGRKNKRHKIGIGFWNREKEINESTKGNKNIEGYVSGGSGEAVANDKSQCISLRARRSENYSSFVTEIEQCTQMLNV